MARRKKKKKVKKMDQISLIKSIRKPMPPKTRVIQPKDLYDRKDESWKDDVEKD